MAKGQKIEGSEEHGLDQKLDFQSELAQLEAHLEDLKVQFEQHFMGLRALAPDGEHRQVRTHFRKLLKAPFKNSAINYRLRAIESRYQTYKTYWERVMRQREEGTYVRDVFKAELHEKIAQEEQWSQTAGGKAEQHMQDLFKTYKSELERQTGAKQNMEFKSFRQTLINQARSLKEKHGVDKVSFKVKVKDGKVTVLASAK